MTDMDLGMKFVKDPRGGWMSLFSEPDMDIYDNCHVQRATTGDGSPGTIHWVITDQGFRATGKTRRAAVEAWFYRRYVTGV